MRLGGETCKDSINDSPGHGSFQVVLVGGQSNELLLLKALPNTVVSISSSLSKSAAHDSVAPMKKTVMSKCSHFQELIILKQMTGYIKDS